MPFRMDEDMDQVMASADEMVCGECQTFPCDCPPSDVYDDADEDSQPELRPVIKGEVVRDWRENADAVSLVNRFAAMAEVFDPYDPNSALAVALRASDRFATIERTIHRMGEQIER